MATSSDTPIPVDPKLLLAKKLFDLSLPSSEKDASSIKEKLKEEVMAEIEKDQMVSLYSECCQKFHWDLDPSKVEAMEASISHELAALDEKIKDAEENLGESEVREALLAKALFFVRIGDKDRALEQLKVTESKTVAVGQKMDLSFIVLRIAFFHLDYVLISSSMEKAKSLFEQGGDWERKNRLKVYDGLLCMSTRNFKRASELFLDSIATFTTYELFSYEEFVLYTVLMCAVSLDRVALKNKVIDSPEVLQVLDRIPHLSPFLNSLYDCQYKKFFQALASLSDSVRSNRYLSPHFRFFLREIRSVAYSQFLESYKSVTLDAMARAFGVSPEFVDRELSTFIASGRLNCRIDSVAGVIITNRADMKNALYQQVIKQGDLLLNRIQRLSRVIDV